MNNVELKFIFEIMLWVLFSPSDTYTWEPMPEFGGEGDAPCPRAGHAAAVVGTRIYIWSGRDGYKKVWNSQVHTQHMAYEHNCKIVDTSISF